MVEFEQRKDGKWYWHVKSQPNGDIVATDGGQGFRDKTDAIRGFFSAWVWINAAKGYYEHSL